MPDWVAEESLVSKAVTLLQQATGCSKGVTLGIEKRIPLMAGLGGGVYPHWMGAGDAYRLATATSMEAATASVNVSRG